MSDLLTKKREQVEELLDEVSTDHKLVLHNDEVNTFDWVIESLVEICQHTYEQAEQCSLIVHFKGKYAVKTGSIEQLKPMRQGLIDRSLSATID